APAWKAVCTAAPSRSAPGARSAANGTGATPQTSANRRRTASLGTGATIAHAGRQRAINRAVRPESVGTTMAFAAILSASSQTAAATGVSGSAGVTDADGTSDGANDSASRAMRSIQRTASTG